ncbi:MAG: glycosyltransferase [Ignavibacteriales bacterium]|nr:glycosyltransferase [Ignavibacteriales bacterium]
MFATKILAISETSKKEVAKVYNINPDKIFVSYLGVNSPQKPYHSLLATNYLLYIGQAFPRRHLKETIIAFKKLVHEFYDLKLVVVGKDNYNPPIINDLIKKINQELGSEKIIYYDYIEKREYVEKLYAGAKALIYVSDREAFGLPPMETLAFGVPPVIMDNELGHELFGDYAFFVERYPPQLVDNIANTIKQALTDQQKIDKIKYEGPEFVKKYNWKNFAETFFLPIRSTL